MEGNSRPEYDEAPNKQSERTNEQTNKRNNNNSMNVSE